MSRPFYSRVQVCHKCQDRHVGCHQDCERYLIAKKKADEEKERIREMKREEFIGFSGNKARQKEAIRRWYRHYGV